MPYESVGSTARYPHEVLVNDKHDIVDVQVAADAGEIALWECMELEGDNVATFGQWKKRGEAAVPVAFGVNMSPAFEASATANRASMLLSGNVIRELLVNPPAASIRFGVVAYGYMWGQIRFLKAAKP